MERNRVISELHGMVHARLFGPHPWLARREVAEALREKLQILGLEEWVSEDTTRATSFGKQVDVDLINVFLGMRDEFEAPEVLAAHRLIDTAEVRRVQNLLEFEEAKHVLRPIVQKAFFSYFNPSR